MALKKSITFAGVEYPDAYHSIGNFNYNECPEVLFVQIWIWRNQEHKELCAASRIPEEVEDENGTIEEIYPAKVEGPLLKCQVPVSVESLGGKENISFAGVYAQIKLNTQYVDAIDV